MALKTHPLKIGLEIHGYLNTKEKLFCKCKTSQEPSEDDVPNSRICPICTGTPGSKPMGANDSAIKKFIQIATVLGSKITTTDLVWHRKHYDWADNPKGYQTTISGSHVVPCSVGGKFEGVNLTEAHLEEDPAQWNPETGKINYNRSGLPLIEIVTEPEFKNSNEVISWLKSLLLSLSYIKATRKNAGIKVDVNISTYGDRVEIKNINSIDKIKKAIEYEVLRQIENNENGITQKRETLTYDENAGITIKMRDKEGSSDYRFLPDPDLPTLLIDKKTIESIKKNLPQMPKEKLLKLIKEFQIDKKNAEVLSSNLDLVEFVEELSKNKIDVSKNISWITIELLRILNYNKKGLEDSDVDLRPEHLAELIREVEAGRITVLKAKQIMNDFIPKSFSLKDHKKEIANIDEEALKNICEKVIKENPHPVKEYKEGKTASLNFLIGQVMKASQRRADFKIAGNILKRLLEE